MIKYKLRYICSAENTDFTFMVSTIIELPFHPNNSDTIAAWDDHHSINNILLQIDDDEFEYIIELEKRELRWQGSREETLTCIKEEHKEMIDDGWTKEDWYEILPDK